MLTGVICETVIWERFTTASNEAQARATVATVVAASRYEGETVMQINIRRQPSSASATSRGRERFADDHLRAERAQRFCPFVLTVDEGPHGHIALSQQAHDGTSYAADAPRRRL
jgi:hypothetical protein